MQFESSKRWLSRFCFKISISSEKKKFVWKWKGKQSESSKPWTTSFALDFNFTWNLKSSQNLHQFDTINTQMYSFLEQFNVFVFFSHKSHHKCLRSFGDKPFSRNRLIIWINMTIQHSIMQFSRTIQPQAFSAKALGKLFVVWTKKRREPQNFVD